MSRHRCNCCMLRSARPRPVGAVTRLRLAFECGRVPSPLGDVNITRVTVTLFAWDLYRRRKTPYERDISEKWDWRPADLKFTDRHEVGYFVGCGVSFSAPPMALGAARMLDVIHGGFAMLEEEQCCGFPLMVLGFEDMIEEMVRHNVRGFVDMGVKRLVTTCACCMSFLSNNWAKYVGGRLPFEGNTHLAGSGGRGSDREDKVYEGNAVRRCATTTPVISRAESPMS